MIIVIDAYNLLKSVLNPRKSTAADEKNYLQKLSKYASIRHHTLVLIFDSGFWDKAYQENKGNLVCWYAGKGNLADDLIVTYVQNHKDKELLVVTSDQALSQCVRKIGVESLKSHLFDSYMQRALHEPETRQPVQDAIIKTACTDNEDLDALMMSDYTTIPLISEEEEKIILKKETLGKKETKRQKLLDRL